MTAHEFDRSAFLADTPVVDWQHPSVVARARGLAGPLQADTIRRCFEWVRDEVRHTSDLIAEFNPRHEVLPFAVTTPGEQLFPGVFAEPLPVVVDALRRYRTRAELEANLPDTLVLTDHYLPTTIHQP